MIDKEKIYECINCGHPVAFDIVSVDKNGKARYELRHWDEGNYDDECQMEMDDGDICGCNDPEIKKIGD